MSDKTFRVKRGETVRVEVARKGGRVDVAQEKPHRAGQVEGDDAEATRYLRRRREAKPRITLLDLGTRLRSVQAAAFDFLRLREEQESAPVARDDYFNEYLEIRYNGACAEHEIVTNPLNITICPPGATTEYARLPPCLTDAEEISRLDRAVLGLIDNMNPFGRVNANVTNRVLPICLPLPHERTEAWNDLKLTVGTSVYLPTPDESAADAVRWRKRAAQDADATEHWNPRCVELGMSFEHGYFEPESVSLPIKVEGTETSTTNALARSRMYLNFDTSDIVEFKITDEPRFTANAVAPRIAPKAALEIYLKPKMVLYWNSAGTFVKGNPNGGLAADVCDRRTNVSADTQGAMRLPVYAPPDSDDAIESQTVRHGKTYVASYTDPPFPAVFSAPTYDYGGSNADEPPLTSDESSPTCWYGRAGTLAGAFKVVGKVYYVWRNGSSDWF